MQRKQYIGKCIVYDALLGSTQVGKRLESLELVYKQKTCFPCLGWCNSHEVKDDGTLKQVPSDQINLHEVYALRANYIINEIKRNVLSDSENTDERSSSKTSCINNNNNF